MNKSEAVLLMIMSIIVIIICVLVLILLLSKDKNTKKVKENDLSNKYTGIKAVSFFFPIIGLIIYAVNIGKNDELAKISLKWVSISFITIIVLVIVIPLILILIMILYATVPLR